MLPFKVHFRFFHDKSSKSLSFFFTDTAQPSLNRPHLNFSSDVHLVAVIIDTSAVSSKLPEGTEPQ